MPTRRRSEKRPDKPQRQPHPRKPTQAPVRSANSRWTQIAVLLRRIADLLEAPENEDLARANPRRRAIRSTAPLSPLTSPTEEDMRRAKEDLRRLGYKIK